MHPWVWGRMRLYGVQGTQSVRADDEPETRPIIGEEGSTLRLTTTERRLKPRTSPESQPRLGFTGASKKFCPSSFFPELTNNELHLLCRRISVLGDPWPCLYPPRGHQACAESPRGGRG
jgi:hypothetical protein